MSKASEQFEKECAEYLNKKYGGKGLSFINQGGSDSNAPDIIIKRNGTTINNIEVKMDGAQCSQFVLKPDEASRKFIYSSRNRPPKPSNSSLAIMKEMEKDFDKHKTPSPAELGFPKALYRDRIVDYYVNFKSSKFFMTKDSSSGKYIIFPTENVSEYFDITACFRYKPSGSHNPKDDEIARSIVLIEKAGLRVKGQRKVKKDAKEDYTDLLIEGARKDVIKIEEPFRLQIRKVEGNYYRLTILSDTKNPNVIFTIKLNKPQQIKDLRIFEESLSK